MVPFCGRFLNCVLEALFYSSSVHRCVQGKAGDPGPHGILHVFIILVYTERHTVPQWHMQITSARQFLLPTPPDTPESFLRQNHLLLFE